MVPIELKCDDAVNPVGIESPNPRLGWLLETAGNRRRAKQTAYEIGVASDREKLDRDVFDLWSSGKVKSDEIQASFAGKSPGFGRIAYWKVRVWDESGAVSPWSDAASWIVGLAADRDWHAKWIGSPVPLNRENPLPIFRKSIEINQPVKSAFVFFCGMGHAELRVNGSSVTDDVLEPAWSMFDKTTHYVGHDVTSFLVPGSNVLAFWLGQGMYNVIGMRYKKFKRSFGPHRLIAQLHLHFEDGSTQLIGTDESWRTTDGPITFTCIFGGEDYDAAREQSGWEKPGFDDGAWDKVAIIEEPIGTLTHQKSPPIRVMRRYSPIRTTSMPDGRKVIDFGQNMSGWPTLKASGPRGSKLTIRIGELLGEDGFPSQQSTGSPISFSYSLKGDGIETWRPRFTYTGYRYVDVAASENVKFEVGSDFIHSSAGFAGDFECSSDLFNRMHTLINKAALCNLQHVLTDCPHREKLGWLEQLHLMQPSIMWNYDLRTFFAKVCGDMRDSQYADGMVPTIAPEMTVFKDKDGKHNDFGNSPEWGAASILTPWQAYERYGDASILADNFAMMTRYLDYLTSRATDGVISFGLADWYDIGPGDHGFSKLTSKAMTGTAIYYRSARAVADSARVLGKPDVAKRYDDLAATIKTGFNRALFDPIKIVYDRGSQCACAMALSMGLVAPQHRDAILKQLVDDIRSHDNHITAGDVGFRFVIQALSDAGRADVVYDLMMPATPPSYGSQLAANATTLTEAWDAAPKNSQNHLMLGHAEAWFWEELAGLHIDLTQPKGRQIVFRPRFVGDINFVKASYKSAVGPIAIQWKRDGDRATIALSVPPNQSAILQLPQTAMLRSQTGKYAVQKTGLQAEYVVESGDHEFALVSP